MSKIIQLSEDIVSKIAAGEVIERPKYVVKELVENALDAGATSIIIHIEQSGLGKITVIDDGEGMSASDLGLAIKPHTTSKLQSEDMLHSIATLGFRGEALASIAAISNLSISSRTKDENIGTLIEIRNCQIEKEIPTGMSAGTQVTVENLFGSVPARKKFLKSERTEFRHIVELISEYALVYPRIRFVLTHNGKQLFDLPSTQEPTERIAKLLGSKVLTSLVPVEHEDSYIRLTGFVAKPQEVSRTGQKQYVYVNSRRVTDKLIAQTVKEAFGTLLDQASHPVFLLFLTLPYDLVDVNVHPRKEHIRFHNTQLVSDAVRKAVAKTLGEHNLSFQVDLFDSMGEEFAYTKKGATDSYAAELLKETVLPWDIRSVDKIMQTDIVQLHNLYLLTQTTRGFVLIDQHAAHERILYEQYLQAFLDKKKLDKPFQLAKPLSLELSVSDAELLEEHAEMFEQVGFGIEHFGKSTYVIHSVPLLFRDRDSKKLIHELLEDLAEEKTPAVDTLSKRMIAYLACRSAVMAGEKLTKKQMKELVEKLEQTPNNATCPHGRPTKIGVSLERLHKLFKRN